MINKILYIVFLFLGFVISTSCSTVKLSHGTYKNIEENYTYKFKASDTCLIKEHRHKILFYKKLQGKKCLKTILGNRICTDFTNGLFDGKYFEYVWDKDAKSYVLKAEGNYRNGVLDGVFYDYFKVYSQKEQKEINVTRKRNYEYGYVNGFMEIYEDNHLVRKAEYKNSVKEGYEYFYTEDNNVDTIHYTYHPNYKSFRTIAYIKEKSFCPVLKTYNSDQFQYIEGKFSINGALNPSSGIDDYTPLFILDYQCYIKQLKEPRSHYYIVDYGGFYGSLYIVSPPFGPIKLGLIDMDDL